MTARAPIIVALCVLVCLVIALVNWPGTSMPKRVAEMVILLLELVVEIYLVVQRIRFVRWRREYELSIDRVIRTIQPGCEGGSAVEW
jgi:membrane protein YdbS with pleckstrin-like domain